MDDSQGKSNNEGEISLLQCLSKPAYRLEDLMGPLARPFTYRELVNVD